MQPCSVAVIVLSHIRRKVMGFVRQTKANITEQVKYSKIYRNFHWAIAITFIVLLFIFLRMTWKKRESVAAIMQD
jgi:hypothetical protein